MSWEILIEVDLQLCYPHPKAREIDRDAVEAMAASIADIGLLQPITVRPVQKSRAGQMCDAFEVLAGLHRVKAFRQLQRETIPVMIVDVDDLRAEMMVLDGNLQRNDLSSAEKPVLQAQRSKLCRVLHDGTECGAYQEAHRERRANEFARRAQLRLDRGEPQYPSRERLRGFHEKYISTLLRQLAGYQQWTNPADGEETAVDKDLNAFSALKTAGDLVRAVAGWALDHQCGLASQGLQFVPLQPSGTKDHPEYLEQRARVDSHEHERNGASLASKDSVDSAVGRRLLLNLLQANPGAFPSSLQVLTIEALRALDYGESLPLLRPQEGLQRKRRYRELRLQLQALGFVEYRTALGQKRYSAQNFVSKAYGVSADTLRTWEKRLRDEFGHLEVARTRSFASNTASWVNAGRTSPSRTTELTRDVAIDSIERGERRFGDATLKAAGQEYIELLAGRHDLEAGSEGLKV